MVRGLEDTAAPVVAAYSIHVVQFFETIFGFISPLMAPVLQAAVDVSSPPQNTPEPSRLCHTHLLLLTPEVSLLVPFLRNGPKCRRQCMPSLEMLRRGWRLL